MGSLSQGQKGEGFLKAFAYEETVPLSNWRSFLGIGVMSWSNAKIIGADQPKPKPLLHPKRIVAMAMAGAGRARGHSESKIRCQGVWCHHDTTRAEM